MYRVLIGFCDGENGKAWAASQGGVRYEPGDIYPRAGFTPSESHIAYLMGDNNKFRAPLIVVDDDTATTEGGADVLQCPHCDKQYKTAEGLAKHIAEKHPAAPAQVTDDAAATEGGAEA